MYGTEELTVHISSTTNKAKRKCPPEAADEARVIRRRAAKACVSCRTRKVRCDILVKGDRCTNCCLDNLECVVKSSKRGRGAVDREATCPTQSQPIVQSSGLTDLQGPGPRQRSDISPGQSTRDNTSTTTPMTDTSNVTRPQAISDQSAAISNGQRATRMAFTPAPTPVTNDDVPVCLTFDDEDASDDPEVQSDQVSGHTLIQPPNDHRRDQAQAQDFFLSDIAWTQNAMNARGQQVPVSSASPAVSTGRLDNNKSPALQLPAFIRPLPQSLDQESMTFLASKGVFEFPSTELRNKILHSYFTSIHSFMPILNLCEWSDTFTAENRKCKVSLLLFHAVMFAGLASLRPADVQSTGYKTVKQARKVAFAKVRFLHDLDAEPDEIAVLQSLLLMSMWYERWDDRKHTWYWTGQALSLAQSMNLHREFQGPCIDVAKQRLHRRLWWSLYIRDRLIALGTRRPLRIRDDEFNLSMLTIEDFEPEITDASMTKWFSVEPAGRDSAHGRISTSMCIALAKLCVSIGRVLSTQYTVLGSRSVMTNSLFVVPRMVDERMLHFDRCEEELQAWYKDLEPEVRRVAMETANGVASERLTISWSILHMIYLTSVSLLHRPQILQPCDDQTQEASKRKIKDCARKLTKILHTMLRRDQIHFLPTSGIPASLSAALGHMLDIKSNEEDVRDVSIFRFYQTMQVLQRLRDTYAAADSAVHFLAAAVRKSGLTAPIQWSEQPTPSFMTAGTAWTSSEALTTSSSTCPDGTSQRQPMLTSNIDLHTLDRRCNTFAGPQPDLAQLDRFAQSGRVPSTYPSQSKSMARANDIRASGGAATQENRLALGHDVVAPTIGQSATNDTYRGYGADAFDPTSLRALDENYLATSIDQASSMREQSISQNYDFGSDIFGLLDVAVPGLAELDMMDPTQFMQSDEGTIN